MIKYSGRMDQKDCLCIVLDTTMSGSRKLSQAKQWQHATDHSQQESADVSDDQIPSASSEPKRLCSSIGCVHDKTLITSIPDAHTAFGFEIRYHRSCWCTYVSDHKTLTEESAQHLQYMNLREAQTLFFEHVCQVIFEDHEFWTLQGLLKDYKCIVANYGHHPQVKSSYLKELLQEEFDDSIGFHQCIQKNVSELVYDTSAGGTYGSRDQMPYAHLEWRLSKYQVSALSIIFNVYCMALKSVPSIYCVFKHLQT